MRLSRKKMTEVSAYAVIVGSTLSVAQFRGDAAGCTYAADLGEQSRRGYAIAVVTRN